MVTQRELAAMACLARENVNRILKNWEQQNVLRRAAQTYRIATAPLKREATGDNGLGGPLLSEFAFRVAAKDVVLSARRCSPIGAAALRPPRA